MRLLTKLFRKTIVLGLAVLGVYKAWELVSANWNPAHDRAVRAKNRVGAVVRQAETEVKDASRDAADSVLDASRIAVAEVAEAVAEVALGESETTTAEPSSRTA